MCTLSYLPLKEGCFLVNNRDESPLRAIALEPQIIQMNGMQIMCPIDAEANGSWIGVNNFGRMACLMNGAFTNHIKKPFYRKSRGKITLEFLAADDVNSYFDKIDLEDIEPFTLIIIDRWEIKVFRWDETKKYSETLDNSRAYNWSSSTLYNEEIAQTRKLYFNDNHSMFLNDPELVLAWHKDQISSSPGIILDRPLVRTVSITAIEHKDGNFKMVYEDLINKTIVTENCEIKSTSYDLY